MRDDLDERVEVVDYDPAWPHDYREEASKIGDLLPQMPVEHIGSTSVVSLPAKPVIDLMLGVTMLPPVALISSALSRIGYVDFGEAGVPGRYYYRKRGRTNFNLHAVLYGGVHWRNSILFRDHLRSHPETCRRYADAKLAAIEGGHASLLAYSSAKVHLIQEILSAARDDTAVNDRNG